MRAAIIHDVALADGGGMTIARAMRDALDADLYVGIAGEGVLNESDREYELFSGLGRSLAVRNARFRSIYNMWRFLDDERLHEYDVIIESGSGAEWYTPSDRQAVVRYVHNPAPLVYSKYGRLSDSVVGRLLGLASRTLREPTYRYPEVWLTNSEETRRRVRHYLDVEAEVLYPPVDVSGFQSGPNESYHLLISRLTESKRVPETVRAFVESDQRLVVCGAGPLEDELRETYADDDAIDVRGWVSEETKRTLLAGARSLVVPSGKESFGIVTVEAFASGIPVVAREGGFTDYLIDDGWNGYRYSSGDVVDAARSVSDLAATKEELQSFAERFSLESFTDQLTHAVEKARAKNTVDHGFR